MKVAFILPSLEATGPIIFTDYLLNGLDGIIEKADVFYFKDKGTQYIKDNVHKLSFFESIDWNEYDIVHTTMALPDLYGAIRVKDKQKWIVATHNYFIDDLSLLYGKRKAFWKIMLWKYAFKKCTNMIVSSNEMKKYYERVIGNKNYEIIPYGIYEKEYTDINEDDKKVIKEYRNRGLTVLGTIGGLIPRKGFQQLTELLKERNDIAVVIIGEGFYRKDLEAMFNTAGISDRIYMPGFRDNSFNLYRYVDAYIATSYSEGFGLAMLEAMSKSLPVITARLPIYTDFFTDDDVVFFELDNSGSLIAAYDKFANDSERYAKASRRLFEETFNCNTMGVKHLEFYKKVSGKK